MLKRREGTFLLDLLLDGVSQFSLMPSVANNSLVHIGTNSIALVAGLMFDEIILNYTLTSALDASGASIGTTIRQFLIGGYSPNVPGGFTSGISYNAAIDVPALLALFGVGLAGLGYSCRKKA